jgi:hypothetical protein
MSNIKIPQLVDISARNINEPSINDLLAEQLESYKTLKRRRPEQLGALEK